MRIAPISAELSNAPAYLAVRSNAASNPLFSQTGNTLTPSTFLKSVLGRPTTVTLTSGVQVSRKRGAEATSEATRA